MSIEIYKKGIKENKDDIYMLNELYFRIAKSYYFDVCNNITI